MSEIRLIKKKSRIPNDLVVEIRRLLQLKCKPNSIVRRFGISRSTVRAIQLGTGNYADDVSPDRIPYPSTVNPELSSKIARCPKCGAKCIQPCFACYIKENFGQKRDRALQEK